jgi:hypothetical protein
VRADFVSMVASGPYARVTLWALASDEDRLAGAVLDLREQIEGVQSGV